MTTVLTAVGRALGDLYDRRIIAILFLPMLGALALWAVMGWWLWADLAAWVRHLVSDTLAGKWIERMRGDWVIQSAATLALIMVWIPAILVTAMIITELVAMPVIVRRVAELHYPRLARKAGGTAVGSMVNAVIGIVAFCTLWIVTLPLWLTGLAALVLPPLLSGYLNQRLFRYDALADHASREEYGDLVQATRGRLFLLGLLLAGLYYVPIVNLLAPTTSGLAFTHFCLGELTRMRAERREERGERRKA